MLLLTDRVTEAFRLQAVLQAVEPCTVLPLHRALDHPPTRSVVVCDVALDSLTSVEILSAALDHHRSPAENPLLCLTRDPSHLALTQARAVGASSILPYPLPPNELLTAVKQLMVAERQKVASVKVADRFDPTKRQVQANVKEAANVIGELFNAAQQRKPIPVASVRRGGNAMLSAVGHAKIRVWLDMVWRYDDLTYQHCLLVAGLAASFARRLGLSFSSQQLISQAALVHDIGKAHIPHAIITKPGRLSIDEMAVMRTHAAIGHDLLVGGARFDQRLLDIVRHHHEYMDGTGYPHGLKGPQIPNFVRMVTICDIYAALIERRYYKAPASPEAAMAIIVEMGSKLDGSLVTAFGGMVCEP